MKYCLSNSGSIILFLQRSWTHLNLMQNPKAISLHSEQINHVEQLMIMSILVSECLKSKT